MGKKVLLAEDSLTIQKVFELTFRGSEIALTMVDNGADAVRLAGEIGPDLVIADVTLPGKDGFDVASELRQSDRTKACPVLILSGTLGPFDEEKFRKSGASGVIFKPFESQELMDKIDSVIRGAGAVREEEKKVAKAAAEETWDFSDVIEEVEEEAARPPGPVTAVAPKRAEDLLAGIVSPPSGPGPAALGEFDISLEELEGGPAEAAAPAPPLTDIVHSFDEAVEEKKPEEPAAAAPPPFPSEETDIDLHVLDELFQDSPPAVTDIGAALEVVEEVEELEVEEELSLLEGGAAPPPAAERPSEAPAPPPVAPPPVPAAPPIPEVPAVATGAPPPEASALAAVPSIDAAALREAFTARAQEIIGKVAAETMEKVLWDTMDRLSSEMSARIKEAVEAVAWEVIPKTAENLIREEIERLRGQVEKKSP